MSSQVSTDVERRGPNSRSADTIMRLLDAGRQELGEVSYDELTIRAVAARAGVSPATAYTYFGSKDHLVAELFWQVVAASSADTGRARTVQSRLQRTMRTLAEAIGSQPALAAAANRSMLGNDPDVHRLRMRVGGLISERFATALGPRDDDLLDVLLLGFFGALLQTGMGFGSYDDLGDRLDRLVAVVMKGRA